MVENGTSKKTHWEVYDLLACSVHFFADDPGRFLQPTSLGDLCKIPEKSPKSSTNKMHRACVTLPQKGAGKRG